MYARLALIFALTTSLFAQVPVADHHTHLISPAAAEFNSETPLPAVTVPDAVAKLLAERTKHWDDAKALARLFAETALVLDPDDAIWMRGRDQAAAFLSTRFARAYAITPVDFSADGNSARIAAYYTRPNGARTRYFAHVTLGLQKDARGTWRIALEAPVFKGPYTTETHTADQLIQQLDEAGIAK